MTTLSLIIATQTTSAAQAATLSTTSLSLSDPTPSQSSVTYSFTASNVSLAGIECIKAQFNTALDGSGTMPTGTSLTGVSLNSSSTLTKTPVSWTPTGNNGTGTITITDSGFLDTPTSATGRTLILGGITNSSAATTTPYYVLLSTYSDTSCTAAVDTASFAYLITTNSVTSVTVDPSMTFTVAAGPPTCNGVSISAGATSSSTAIGLGHVNTVSNAIGDQQLSVTSNGGGGYSVYVKYTGPMTSNNGSGSYHLADLAGASEANPIAFPSSGTEAVGYTTSDVTMNPLGPGVNRFNPSGTAMWSPLGYGNTMAMYSSSGIATGTGSDQICVAYQVGVSNNTPASNYAMSVVYTAIPMF